MATTKVIYNEATVFVSDQYYFNINIRKHLLFAHTYCIVAISAMATARRTWQVVV